MKDVKKAVVAPQAFKDSLSGAEAARALAQGVRAVWPNAEIVQIPIADGGDGMLDALLENFAEGYIQKTTQTTDALGRPCSARWLTTADGETAIIETAEANGIAKLKPSERNALTTTTYGIGRIFKDAVAQGCKTLTVGVGGSATNDGGAGLAQAMGARLLDENGAELTHGGINLSKLARIDGALSGLDGVKVNVSCDVTNPLCGPSGASAVFGPQKGASPDDVKRLDAALENYARVIKRDLGKSYADFKDYPGAGAAGGLGAGLRAFFGAELRPGADVMLDAVRFDERIQGAQLLIVGEGKFDHSSNFNKAPTAAAKRAKKYGIPVIGIGGSIGAGFQSVHESGVSAVFSIINQPMTLEHALKNASALIAEAAEQACRAFAL